MDELEDIYIGFLGNNYLKKISFFLDNYLIGLEEVIQYYEYPQYFGITEFETTNLHEMINYVLKKENRCFRFYFDNKKNGTIKNGMIFINNDGSLFLGITVLSTETEKFILKIKNDFNNNSILICNQVLPPSNFDDFIKIIE